MQYTGIKEGEIFVGNSPTQQGVPEYLREHVTQINAAPKPTL